MKKKPPQGNAGSFNEEHKHCGAMYKHKHSSVFVTKQPCTFLLHYHVVTIYLEIIFTESLIAGLTV